MKTLSKRQFPLRIKGFDRSFEQNQIGLKNINFTKVLSGQWYRMLNIDIFIWPKKRKWSRCWKNWKRRTSGQDFPHLPTDKWWIQFFVASEENVKSKYNVVTPDDICNEYALSCMKCSWGHLNKRKPWNTQVFLEFWFLKVVSLVFWWTYDDCHWCCTWKTI
jgi:hypothetical protein